MAYRLAADALVIVHAAFVLFVVAGGLLALRWRRILWVHAPAALWGVWIELAGWICPLTPLENWLRQQDGEAGYSGSFIEHYLLPVLYPSALTRGTQILLGGLALAVNLFVYWWVLSRPPQRG